MENKLEHEYSLIFISVIIGILVGLLSLFYAELVETLSDILYKKAVNSFYILLLPPAGGLLIGLLMQYGTLSARGHGIPAILEAIKTKKVNFTSLDLWLEGFASAITIGTGDRKSVV